MNPAPVSLLRSLFHCMLAFSSFAIQALAAGESRSRPAA
jgi:hypothetical protein